LVLGILGACIGQVYLQQRPGKLTRYESDLVGVQEVKWDKVGMLREGDYNFFLWKGKQKSSIGNRIFCTPQNSISS